MPKCDTCGKFMRCESGASWAMRFSGWPPMPDHEATRCPGCTEAFGPLEADHHTKPEMTSGLFT
jgi:hypothetical protein